MRCIGWLSKRGGTAIAVGVCATVLGMAAPGRCQTGTGAQGAGVQPAGAGHAAGGKVGKKPKAGKKAAEAAPEAAAPVTPVPAPNWPANASATPAAVDWNGRDLKVAAANSSLTQILRDIATATGLKVEGLGGDQRVFGNFGPAPAREVLNALLDGSGYNVLMVGDSGEGTPRELVLTARVGGPSLPNQINHPQSAPDDEPADDPPPPVVEEPRRPFNGQPQQPRTPEDMRQELRQQREAIQQQMQQQQQQQQANPNTPPQQQPLQQQQQGQQPPNND